MLLVDTSAALLVHHRSKFGSLGSGLVGKGNGHYVFSLLTFLSFSYFPLRQCSRKSLKKICCTRERTNTIFFFLSVKLARPKGVLRVRLEVVLEGLEVTAALVRLARLVRLREELDRREAGDTVAGADVLVAVGVDVGNDHVGLSGERLGDLLVVRSQLLAVSAPGGVKLDENVLIRVQDNLVEVARVEDDHRRGGLLDAALGPGLLVDVVDDVLQGSSTLVRLGFPRALREELERREALDAEAGAEVTVGVGVGTAVTVATAAGADGVALPHAASPPASPVARTIPAAIVVSFFMMIPMFMNFRAS